jgi:hypothetical protein
MAFLEQRGIAATYPVDRALDLEEKRLHLEIDQAASNTLTYDLSLIQFNSTYIECTDKGYPARGILAMFGAILASFLIGALVFTSVLIVQDWHPLSIFLIITLSLCLWLAIYLLNRDVYAYTHYPIRLNRQNKYVYVFRRNGTVLKAKWGAIYWTICGHGPDSNGIYISGHVMGNNKTIVKESFSLSLIASPYVGGERQLQSHFEFFRRYMQDGPSAVLEALKPTPLIMLPGIYKQRESWRFGWERLTLNLNGLLILQILFQVFIFPMSLFRYVAMRTSKIPQWPQWVLDECKIEPSDLWVRDERHAA